MKGRLGTVQFELLIYTNPGHTIQIYKTLKQVQLPHNNLV
jgi:hypothetical protein